MDIKRLWYILRISLMKNGFKRANYIKKKNIFYGYGDNCFYQPRNIPPEAKLIKMGDNVVVASEVLFINHDAIHYMLNHMEPSKRYSMNLGAIEIGNNVFIGARTIVLPGTLIGDNVIIGAGSLVKGYFKRGGVYAGVPARRIGEFSDFVRKTNLYPADRRAKAERFDNIWADFRKWKHI